MKIYEKRAMKINIKDLLFNARYRNRIIHDYEMRNGMARFFSKPVHLQIEPTNRCNLACVMCARPYYDKEKNVLGDMSIETFDRLRPYLKVAEEVMLIGYGEPLIAKNFWYFLETCRDLGVKTSIHTNGVMLDKKTSVRLIRGGLGTLTVSLDAAREETLKALRGCSLKKITQNIIELNRLKEEMGVSTPQVNVYYILMKDNLHQLLEMVDVAAGIGAEMLVVTHLMVYSTDLDEQSVLHIKEEAEPVFREAEKRARDKGLLLSLPSLLTNVIDCMQPFELLFINWDGKVRACCSAAFISDKFSFPIGDLNTEELGSIWNNDNMIGIRKGLLGKGKMAPECAQCGFRKKDIEGHRRYLDAGSKD